MAEKKIIAVVGATGAQGGGLVRAISEAGEGEFAARAITRSPHSERAQELAALGAEVVAADVNDPESLRRAFEGAHGVFCVTFFWEHFSPDMEIQHARNMADAARASGVGHAIWSTLEDTRNWVPLDDDRMPTLMDRYKVPHFDAKGEANRVFEEAGVPTTFLLTSFYWDNLVHFGMGPRADEAGNLSFALPMGDARLPGIAAEDIGRCALGIFRRGDEHVGRTVGIAGEHPTGAEMASVLGKALGRTVTYVAVPFASYRELEFPGAEDLGNMFQFKHDFNDYFCGARSIEFSRSLHPGLYTFERWVDENRDRIPIQ